MELCLPDVLREPFSGDILTLPDPPGYDQGNARRDGDGGDDHRCCEFCDIIVPEQKPESLLGNGRFRIQQDKRDDRIDQNTEQAACEGTEAGLDLYLQFGITDDEKHDNA